MIKRGSSYRVCTAAFAAWVICSVTVLGQENPKIEGPTLRPKANTAPPLPPPAPVTKAASTNAPAVNGKAAAPAADSTPTEEKAEITFRFESQPVADALKLYSELTGRTPIHPHALAGVVTINTKTPLTRSEAILALESVLFANGVSVIPMGDKFFKAAANPSIIREIPQLAKEGTPLPEGDRITAQVLPLRYLDVADPSLIQSLSQFIHQPGGTLLPLARANSLLIIDTTLTIKRLMEILDRLDQPVENRIQTKFYQLKNADATKVAATLQALVTGVQPAATPGGVPRPVTPPRPPGTVATGPSEESLVVGKLTIQADDRTNTLIILSRPSNFEFLDEIIDALDRTVEPEIRFASFKLQHIKADEAADIILSLTGSGSQPTIQRQQSTRTERNRRPGGRSYGGRETTTTPPPTPQLPPIATRPGTTAPGGTQPGQGVEKSTFVLSERARVIPDPRQGSILVLGTANDLDLVERIIPEVDVTVAQVIIESVIVEITLNESTDFGINLLQREWQKGSIKGAGASFPTGVASNLLINPSTLINPGAFASLAGLNGLTYFAELGGLDLDLILRAAAGSSNFKILQRPLLQSSQNEPAHIFVGETRPVITSTAQNLIGDGSTLRSNVEQYDIGVSLDITPNITPGGLVELQVEQVIDDVAGEVVIDGNPQPIVSRRELNSLVSVRDRGVVALGGLIKNRKEKREDKVPVIGDIPLLGLFFKQTHWQENRVELVVFLRPTVLRSVDDAQTEAQKMRDKFKGLNNIPAQDVPPLPSKEPEKKQPWYAPFQPPPS